MLRLVLIVLMVATLFMPRRFYRRYMQITAALACLFLTLVIIAYEKEPSDASSNDIYILVGFVGMNAALILTKYLLLKNRTPS